MHHDHGARKFAALAAAAEDCINTGKI